MTIGDIETTLFGQLLEAELTTTVMQFQNRFFNSQ